MQYYIIRYRLESQFSNVLTIHLTNKAMTTSSGLMKLLPPLVKRLKILNPTHFNICMFYSVACQIITQRDLILAILHLICLYSEMKKNSIHNKILFITIFFHVEIIIVAYQWLNFLLIFYCGKESIFIEVREMQKGAPSNLLTSPTYGHIIFKSFVYRIWIGVRLYFQCPLDLVQFNIKSKLKKNVSKI